MNTNSLHTLGKAYVDEPLAYTVQQYESAFPHRVRAYYLLGSYADECAVMGSDIDMYILFKETFVTAKEAIQAQQLAQACAKKSILRFDINAIDEQTLLNYHSIMKVALKRESVLLFGEDTRDTMTLPSREAYTHDITDGVIEFILRLHRLDAVTYPIHYPDPHGLFYGYDHLMKLSPAVAALHSPDDASDTYYVTRDLVECASRMATALVAFQTGSFIATKRGSVQVYQREIHDEWSPFLITMFEKGKMQWMYGLPKSEEERAELRTLCEKMLAFENHYLLQYRTYLLDLLSSEEQQNVQFALQRLKTVHFDDEEMNTARHILDSSKRTL